MQTSLPPDRLIRLTFSACGQIENREKFLIFRFFQPYALLAMLKANLTIWDKLTRVVVFLLLCAAIMGIAIWYSPVIDQNERMRKEKLELDKKIEKETEISKKLDSSIKAMQNPRTVERLAREKLSYAKPGETVIHFEPPATNGGSVRPERP